MFGAFGLPTLSYQTTAPSAGDVIASGKVAVYSIRCISAATTRRYVQLFAHATPAQLGEVPDMVLQLEASGVYDWHCYGTPRTFSPGLCWGWSTTQATDTPAAPECWLEMQYILIP